ncbi:hypothetical protein HDV04_001214 [Boothiomyces sp. JEL0838]|nr:hypothetical protein HDV04_001214 [Boothiomyces sp. JEL0838]
MTQVAETYQPPFTDKLVYPSDIEIIINQNYTSKAVIKKQVKKGDLILYITGTTKSKKRWTSVQVGVDEHVELNSELVYMNHSCDPSVILDTSKMCLIANKDLNVGDEVTFFYPSTEYEMDQPFQCWCGSKSCVGLVNGAKGGLKEGYFYNKHILELVKQ